MNTWRTNGAAALVIAVAISVFVAGCAFSNGIATHFEGGGPVTVRESLSAEVQPRHVQGITVRRRQVVRVDCPITIVYDVNEATGMAVLAQTYDAQLRTRALPRRVRYALDCSDPVLLELPSSASAISAQAASGSGEPTGLVVNAPVASVPLARGRQLRAERGTQLAIVDWPRSLATDDYSIDLQFVVPDTSAFEEKAVFAASISCGRSTYMQPVLPLVQSMAKVPALTVRPSDGAANIALPHIAGANALRIAVRHTLACVLTPAAGPVGPRPTG